jgi:hypothetical protein
MDKIISIIVIVVFTFSSCNTKPDYSSEIKSIDSLETEINKSLTECKNLDTSWVNPVTKTSNYNVKMILQVYNPDSIIQEDVKVITYYKGFRKVGMKFIREREKLIAEFQKTLKQLEDLKTDAENGSLKKEDLDKYLLEEKTVTTELIYLFNDLKYSSIELKKNFDSLNPMIEKIIEVYSLKYDADQKKKANKIGITIN